MASEKQIAANRMNAMKSSGPRSVAGKVRASRNAIRHGLAANIWKDPSAAFAIETLTILLRESGHSEQAARQAAAAEYKTNAVNAVRGKIAETLRDAAENGLCGLSFRAELATLQGIDRYEKRVFSRKRRVFRQMHRKVDEL
jgi:hypothetical protein